MFFSPQTMFHLSALKGAWDKESNPKLNHRQKFQTGRKKSKHWKSNSSCKKSELRENIVEGLFQQFIVGKYSQRAGTQVGNMGQFHSMGFVARKSEFVKTWSKALQRWGDNHSNPYRLFGIPGREGWGIVSF